jgi:hypothetical protein
MEEYKKVQHEFQDSNIKKKHIWRKIAQKLAERGYPNVNEGVWVIMWRHLKKTFKEIYVGQGGSRLRIRWEFYNDVEEIFSKDPYIVSAASVPVSTKPFLTTKKIPGPDGQEIQAEIMEVVGNLDEEYVEDGEPIITDNAEEHVYGTFDSSVQQPPAWFREFIQQYHIDEEGGEQKC